MLTTVLQSSSLVWFLEFQSWCSTVPWARIQPSNLGIKNKQSENPGEKKETPRAEWKLPRPSPITESGYNIRRLGKLCEIINPMKIDSPNR